jgi:hypothetical protein
MFLQSNLFVFFAFQSCFAGHTDVFTVPIHTDGFTVIVGALPLALLAVNENITAKPCSFFSFSCPQSAYRQYRRQSVLRRSQVQSQMRQTLPEGKIQNAQSGPRD